MPWREGTRVTERAAMIRKWKSGLYTVTQLAGDFGISRPTVYEWIRRGSDDLADRPSTPKTCPHKTDDAIARQIVSAKEQFCDWGPRKLIDFLRQEVPSTPWPSASAAARILEAAGLVRKRAKRRQAAKIVHARTSLGAEQSGEMMTIDHKGHFRVGTGEYCYPLTIADPVSRYIYAISGSGSPSFNTAKPVMEAVFREYGLPLFIGSDNGGPFCCPRAVGGLSRLSVWWIRLGITPIRIHPGCPWENGRHERMHKTLKACTARPPAATMLLQQHCFDHFRFEFNQLRPHEGLGGHTPSQHLVTSPRCLPRKLPEVEYPGHFEVRRVRTAGEIKFQSKFIFVSETLAGESVGLAEVDDGIWAIYFAHIELALYDERTKSII